MAWCVTQNKTKYFRKQVSQGKHCWSWEGELAAKLYHYDGKLGVSHKTRPNISDNKGAKGSTVKGEFRQPMIQGKHCWSWEGGAQR